MKKQSKTEQPVLSNYKAKADYVEEIGVECAGALFGFAIDLPMVFVEGGTFMMGDARDKKNYPVHKVTLSSYHIGKYPVTQAQYKAVMGENPSKFKGGRLPVERVSWIKAMEFCEKLSAQTGKKYTLPSEEQWMFAARGGVKSKGYKYSGSNNVDKVAWYDDNADWITHPVGTKAPNELGICDMSGNVWEWCGDRLNGRHNGNSDNNDLYILRGGAYNSDGIFCSIMSRYRIISTTSEPNLLIFRHGFRVVCLG